MLAKKLLPSVILSLMSVGLRVAKVASRPPSTPQGGAVDGDEQVGEVEAVVAVEDDAAVEADPPRQAVVAAPRARS